MERDYVSIGCTPYNEPCAQVGQDNYSEQSRKECQAFGKQLVRLFGEPPEGASLSIKSFPHEFGSYREVVCWFEVDNEKAREYAFKLENEAPANWDKEAKIELIANGYKPLKEMVK